MNNGKIKATIIKCVSAVLCTALIAYAAVSNVDKICNNNIEISSSFAQSTAGSDLNSDAEFDAQFEDMSNSSTEDNTTSAATDDENPSSATEEQNDATDEDDSSKSDAGTAKKTITLTGGLSSTNIDEVLEYYKLVAKKNSNLKFARSMSLDSMFGGKNISQKMLDVFTPIAQKALAKNTVTDDPFPGKPDKIKASDWQAAKAVNDGTYTTVYVKVVPQTDSYNGSQYEGSCGRTMGVLDGVDRALEELGVVTVDFDSTKMTIKYLDPTVKIKIKNSTGELVKGECEWKYRTYPYIETMDAKILTLKLHLEGAGGYIDYSVKY